MKAFVENTKEPLAPEERNLLSVAYKNVVGAHRSSYRVIASLEVKNNDDNLSYFARKYKEVLIDDLRNVCAEVLVSTVF